MFCLESRLNKIAVAVCLISIGAIVSAGASPVGLSHASVKPAYEFSTYRDVVKSVLPAVVSIESAIKPTASLKSALPRPRGDDGIPPEFRRFFDGFFDSFEFPETPQHGLGSGFIVDSQGVILTNYHVVKGASEVTAHLQDGRTFASSDIKADPKTDLAVIRIKAGSSLPHLDFGDSAATDIGDRVLAVGAPFGLAGSVSAGIVSAKGRRLDSTNYADFLQTDAAINPGNSGGPLVNLEGKVIGINTAIRSNTGGFQGVGLAISSDIAQNIVRKLVKDGAVHRGYLGIQIQDLSAEIRSRLGLPADTGVLVARTVPNSPATKAGVQSGDVIVALAGQTVRSPAELQRRVADLPLNRSSNIKVVRDGKHLEIEVVIEEQPSTTDLADGFSNSRLGRRSAEEFHIERFGIDVAEPTPELRRQFGIASTASGALITNVTPDRIGGKGGLRAGTLITKVNDLPIQNAADAQKALEAASAEQGVLLQVRWPDGAVGYVMLKSTTP